MNIFLNWIAEIKKVKACEFMVTSFVPNLIEELGQFQRIQIQVQAKSRVDALVSSKMLTSSFKCAGQPKFQWLSSAKRQLCIMAKDLSAPSMKSFIIGDLITFLNESGDLAIHFPYFTSISSFVLGLELGDNILQCKCLLRCADM